MRWSPRRPERLLQPQVQLTKDTTIVFDARLAKQVKVTVPQSGAKVALADVGFDRTSADGTRGLSYAGLSFDFDGIYTAQLGPALPPEQLVGHVASQWAKPGANGSFDNSPYVVGQLNTFPGAYPTGFVRAVETKDQATVEQHANAASDRALERIVSGNGPGMGGTWSPVLTYDKAPQTTTLVADGKPATWQTEVDEVIPSTDPNNPFPDTITRISSPAKAFRAGESYRQRFNAAAFTVAPDLAVRSQNDLLVSMFNLADADGNRGYSATDSASSKLIQAGKVVAESPYFGYVEAQGLPADKATYTLESTQNRQSYSAFSTRTELRWTFSSAATDEETRLPLLGIRYQPTVDEHNVAERRPVTVLPVVVDAQPGEALPAIRRLTVQVSGDDGKTWHDAAVAPTGHGRYKAIFVTPKDATKISLRSHLVDGTGKVTDLTVIGAYPLR